MASESDRLYHAPLGVYTTGIPQAPFEALLDWLVADLQAGELAPNQLGIVLPSLSLSNLNVNECLAYLRPLSPGHLIHLLYGRLDEPVHCDRWQNIFAVLRSWLKSSQSVPETQQQNMLIELQKTRVERTQRSQALAIVECRRGLDLANSIDATGHLEDTVRLFEITCRLRFAEAVATSWQRARSWTREMEEDFVEARAMLQHVLADASSSDPSIRAKLSCGDTSLRDMVYFAERQLHVSKIEAMGKIWPKLEKFPIMYSASPRPPPPPAPPVRIRSWLVMVPKWFSFYTLWPHFWW